MRIALLALGAAALAAAQEYFPPPDADGGWRTAAPARVEMDAGRLDSAFAYAATSTRNGGLLAARRGWLVYEKYFGHGAREAMVNTASCGKSFTSIAVGILMGQRPDLFPQGLDTRIWSQGHLPPEAFPLNDPRKAGIRLGQLLAMTAGIPGNNPGMVNGQEVKLSPPGPDGWEAMVDQTALGLKLWRDPGAGYSYATSSIHIASIMVRHVSGMELQEFVAKHLAAPMGWGKFDWGYRRREITHTPGGGGIQPRATDMLRFLYLLLREGRWGDRQLVPAEYVRHCGRLSPYNPHAPASLAFDVNGDGHVPGIPRDAFWKHGSGGHCFYIVPSLDLVIWKLGGRDEQYGKPGTPFKPPMDPHTAGEETLRRVVQAVMR